MKYLFLVSILILNLLFSCSDNEGTMQKPYELAGFWTDLDANGDTITASRAVALKENQNCFAIKENGIFLNQANSGWCGTPPIAYTVYEGVWTKKGNDTLYISVPFWGGMTDFTWKIISINKNELKYVVEELEYIHNK